MVFLNFLQIYNSEKFFPEPTKFMPERWDNHTNKGERPAYFFGHGTRACFGQKLAMMELKSFLFHLLAKFKVQVDPERLMKTEFTFGLSPVGNQAWFVLTPRQAE